MTDPRPRPGPHDDNLFDRWDLDPSAGPQAITERLRERMEEADPPTAVELRRAWEELTMHPRRRIAEALATFPETRPPIGRPPLPFPMSVRASPQPSGQTATLAATAATAATAAEEPHIVHAPVAGALGSHHSPSGALPAIEHDPLMRARSPRTASGGTK